MNCIKKIKIYLFTKKTLHKYGKKGVEKVLRDNCVFNLTNVYIKTFSQYYYIGFLYVSYNVSKWIRMYLRYIANFANLPRLSPGSCHSFIYLAFYIHVNHSIYIQIRVSSMIHLHLGQIRISLAFLPIFIYLIIKTYI